MDFIKNLIIQQIQQKNTFQPILFVGENEEKNHLELEKLITSILEYFDADESVVYRFQEEGKTIKIKPLRDFIQPSSIKPSFLFQIFVIEKISRFTLQSANMVLKFLEEPGIGNIVFLTNKSESGIIDTILSRVKIIPISGNTQSNETGFYMSMIDDYFHKRNLNVIGFLFQEKKIEKEEYILFLKSLFEYIISHPPLFSLAQKIENALQNIMNHNAIPKYEIDKILLSMNEYCFSDCNKII